MGSVVSFIILSNNPKQLLNMKSMMLVALFLALAAASPQADVVIVKQSQEHDTDSGKYSFSYEADNGIKVEESGEQKVIGNEVGTVSKGSYTFPLRERSSPSTGLLMRTDSKPRELICLLLHPFPSTSSSSSLT